MLLAALQLSSRLSNSFVSPLQLTGIYVIRLNVIMMRIKFRKIFLLLIPEGIPIYDLLAENQTNISPNWAAGGLVNEFVNFSSNSFILHIKVVVQSQPVNLRKMLVCFLNWFSSLINYTRNCRRYYKGENRLIYFLRIIKLRISLKSYIQRSKTSK